MYPLFYRSCCSPRMFLGLHLLLLEAHDTMLLFQHVLLAGKIGALVLGSRLPREFVLPNLRIIWQRFMVVFGLGWLISI